ncbi:MAG: zinc-binding alcohol dehydrogenase [Kiritimatiellae bacterium]|nr:zinc-binding alcohol dehydrogenase [Kiritimatiellia bacterium]
MTTPREHAVVMTAKEHAELQEIERDATPLGADEVAGRTLVSLISAGTETIGSYAATHYKVRFPQRTGYAAVFQVEEVGHEVSDLRKGDIVFAQANHQSYQRRKRGAVLRVPDGLAPATAVFARMAKISMTTLVTTRARPPEKVIVTGLGTVGFLAAQIFAHCGYEVIAVEPQEKRRRIAETHGIAPVLPRIPLDDERIAGEIGLVLECSGHEQAVLDGCKIAKRRGEVVLIGVPWRRCTEIYAQEILHPIFYRWVDVRSGWEGELPGEPQPFQNHSQRGNHETALKWLADGVLNVDGIYNTISPRDCQKAYQDILHGRVETLSLMYDWQRA